MKVTSKKLVKLMKKRSIDSINLGSEDSSSDEETDDDSENGKDDNKEGGEKTEGDEPEPEIILKKKVKVGKNFSEEILCGAEGLNRIYEEFPKVFQFRGKGHEASDLSRLTRLYKEWAFQLYSGLAFTDLLKSVHTFSTRGSVRTHIAEMRERERDRYMKNVLGVDLAAGEKLRGKKDELKGAQNKKMKHINDGEASSDEMHDEDKETSNKDDTVKGVPIRGFDDLDVDIAEIEEMERQAMLVSQQSRTKVDMNTPPDIEEDEFDFEEAENAMREQEMAEAAAYLAEQERDMTSSGIAAQ